MKTNRGELPGMVCCAGIYIWRGRRGRLRGTVTRCAARAPRVVADRDATVSRR